MIEASASRAPDCTLRGSAGHARQEQSGRDAAIIGSMYDAARREELAQELAAVFLAAPWSTETIAEAGAGALDRWPSWMTRLAMSVTAAHRVAPVDRPDDLVQQIRGFLDERGEDEQDAPLILRLTKARDRPSPPSLPERRGWPIAEIATTAQLADRLELSAGQLAWLADVRGWERSVTDERLRNYRYRLLPRTGGIPRVIEAPKLRLKEIQRWLLGQILNHVSVHEAAHGFTRERSAVTHAELHVDAAAVLHLDLKDFFASVAAGRVYGIWRALNYSPPVAHVLTGLTTNVIPSAVSQIVAESTPERAVTERFRLGRQLATPHLPQGAPTSPALANLAAFGLDRRLDGLARASGLRYSRYADDLTFSGPARLHRRRRAFESVARTIIHSEGFALNESKSAIQSDGGRQNVCGIVVNTRTNMRRDEYDQLRATLHNAAKHGPGSQNRENVPEFRAHLLGRISWAEALNPARGEKLRAAFDRIQW